MLTKCQYLQFLFTIIISVNYHPGKPRSPIFSSEMREILSGVGAVNISWSCDSFYPVTQYYLHYRQYKVRGERQTLWREVCLDVNKCAFYCIYFFKVWDSTERSNCFVTSLYVVNQENTWILSELELSWFAL